MEIEEFKIERYYGKYEFTTKYMLSSSDSETWSIMELLNINDNYEIYLHKFLELKLGYTESQGSYPLRKAIAKHYIGLTDNHILIFSGAEEAIFCFMMSVLRPKDEIIVMFPCYQSLMSVAEANEINVNKWLLDEENMWQPSFKDLNAMITSKTKAIIINSPHNPTGFHFIQKDFMKLVTICKENSILLFSDEVYRWGEYNTTDRISSAAEIYDKAISLGVLSKPIGLPGLRIGWIASKNTALLEKLQAFKDYTTICNSAPSEFLGVLAMDNLNTLISRNQKIISKNLGLLRLFMRKYSDIFSWVEPKAGSIAFIRILSDMTADELCEQLRQKKDILLLPSTTYDFGNQHFRIGFGRANFSEALDQLAVFVEEELRQ